MTSVFRKSDLKAKYEIGELLGKGNFAEVKKGINKETGEEVAIKIVTIRDQEDYEAIKTEIEILARLKHPNVIQLKEIFERGSKFRKCAKVYIVMELVTGGELFDKIVDKKTFHESEARTVIRTILETLQFCHAKGVVHRDLKPENILLAHPGDDAPIKIADFGLSKIYDPDTQKQDTLMTMCGTPGYVAPEILKKRGYDVKVDMWSTGVILYILLCGFPPFYEEQRDKLFKKIMRGDYSFPSPHWDAISDDAIDMVTCLLTVDPTRRMTINQALKHKWMQAEVATIDNHDIFTEKLKSYVDRIHAQKKWKRYMHAVVAINRLIHLHDEVCTV